MSAYLRALLQSSPEPEDKTQPINTKPVKVMELHSYIIAFEIPNCVFKKLPGWLDGIQSLRPVTYDTSELYEEQVTDNNADHKKQQFSAKKCYECDEMGHIAKECPNKWKKRSGARFKDSDWHCSMCGNINWDWRQHCNKCSTPKPTGCNAEKRTGKGGGYNEIDEETLKRLKSKKKDNKKNANNKKMMEKEKETKVKCDNPIIYIFNLPVDSVSNIESKIATMFGQIGRIKHAKKRKKDWDIEISEDGKSARLVYEDSHTAPFAIQWFNNTEFEGKTIVVKMEKDVAESERFGDVVHDKNDYYDDDEEEEEDGSRSDEGEIVENEMDDIEAELFGYSSRGRGRGRGRAKGKVQKSYRKKRGKERERRSRSRSRTRSRSRDRDRHRRSRHGDRDRDRDRARYRPSKRTRSYR